MIQWLGETGALLASYALLLSCFAAAAWIGVRLSELIAPNADEKTGCFLMGALMAAAFLLLGFTFYPAVHILQSYSCRSAADYRFCMGED